MSFKPNENKKQFCNIDMRKLKVDVGTPKSINKDQNARVNINT